MFIRTESFRDFLKFYPVVASILALTIFLFLVYQLASLFHITPLIALFNDGVGYNLGIAQGQLWRLVTPLFLHFTFSHILFNAFSIFLFAPALERILGKTKFIIAFLGSGIISNLLCYFFGDLALAYIGASSAIFGLFGIYLFIIVFRRELIDRVNTQIIGIILLLSVVMTFLTPSTDILGHLFGLLGGFILGPILLFQTTKRRF
ncbi:rhomboid family intramembrane serine protease [Pullulanibacillus sp. KACC 23026]|uniref:rhomboid family intramembrane serine protease n=1 Tax=Pullulanibacillus sp. KACC 23026 TaxID=3028315 RepID=UPI0023B06F33|nr:rhomboid family intramembrane serine protease [Pullulanibacillus sp. KACC 23026]WEG12533.1 rhomboid family intramembrane serine protease [Pullulanibacillus sp. KACC 23026]